MGDLQEMVIDLSRAVELEDYGAAERILRELTVEAARHQLEEIAELLQGQLFNRNVTGILASCRALAARAAAIDKRNHDPFGAGFLRAHELGLAAAYAYENRN